MTPSKASFARFLPVGSLLAVVASVVCFSGCASRGGMSSAVAAGKVTGLVYYPQRIALPPETKLSVRLVDMTDSVKPRTVSEYAKTIGSLTPAPFELGFSPSAIKPDGVYEVFAELTLPGGQVWAHEQHFPVLTGNTPAYVEIRVFPRQ